MASTCYNGILTQIASTGGREQPEKVPVMARSVLLAVSIGLAFTGPLAAEPGVVRDDFRGQPLDENLFRTIGVQGQIHAEPEGLHVTLPAPAVGPRTPASRASSASRAISISRPRSNCSVPPCRPGPEASASPSMPGWTTRLKRRPSWVDSTGKTDRGLLATAACSTKIAIAISKNGTFRARPPPAVFAFISRGSVVTYAVADAGSDAFRPLCDWEIGTADIKVLRLQAENMKSDAPLDVRFLDLEIRSGESFAADGTPLVPEAPSKSRPMMMVILGVAILVVLLALWRRQEQPHRGHGDSTESSTRGPHMSRWLRITIAGGVVIAAVTAAVLWSIPRHHALSPGRTPASSRPRWRRSRRQADKINVHEHPRIADVDLAMLEGLTNLHDLNLDHSLVTDEGMKSIARIPNLRLLSLSETRITDAGLAELGSLTKLWLLRLDTTQITDGGLAQLPTARPPMAVAVSDRGHRRRLGSFEGVARAAAPEFGQDAGHRRRAETTFRVAQPAIPFSLGNPGY